MRDGLPPFRSRAPAVDCLSWYLASGPHRCGFFAPASSTTHASVFPVSPAGIYSVCRSDGCTWTESVSLASRNFNSRGNRRKHPASFPSNCSGPCSSNCPLGQTPATPEPILIDRLESQGIQRDLIHACTSSGFTLFSWGSATAVPRRCGRSLRRACWTERLPGRDCCRVF
jgi:hypothetical protein